MALPIDYTIFNTLYFLPMAVVPLFVRKRTPSVAERTDMCLLSNPNSPFIRTFLFSGLTGGGPNCPAGLFDERPLPTCRAAGGPHNRD